MKNNSGFCFINSEKWQQKNAKLFLIKTVQEDIYYKT